MTGIVDGCRFCALAGSKEEARDTSSLTSARLLHELAEMRLQACPALFTTLCDLSPCFNGSAIKRR